MIAEQHGITGFHDVRSHDAYGIFRETLGLLANNVAITGVWTWREQRASCSLFFSPWLMIVQIQGGPGMGKLKLGSLESRYSAGGGEMKECFFYRVIRIV